MKKFFKFLFYCFLILLVLCFLFAAGYWAVEIKGWSWWIAGVLVACMSGVIFAFVAMKKFLIRRNEKKFVQSVINEETAVPAAESTALDLSLKQAEDQWKTSIAKLQKSHLRRFGNPVYVLPWYMIMGESRSGKTSAIKNSNLSSALTDVSSATIVAGTKNCDWWFLEQAVVLDTAGRYTIPIEEEQDKKEWGAFLALLAKYRKKEPVNGVIVAVAADSLLNEDQVLLSEKAKSIRQRINQMMRVLGAMFPVYLLVTKMDLVNGFTDFCDHIPDLRYDQVMGYANSDNDTDGLKVLDQCMTSVSGRIRELRSLFVHNRINNFAISFSGEFMNLKPGLEAYVSQLFAEDIYQATPLFRGVYFSSATRKGMPGSDFLKTAGITYSNDAALDRNKGFFLRSFFNAVLPKDRNVFKPLSEFIMWRRTTISLTIFSLCLLCLAISGVLAFSYVNNAKAISAVDRSAFQQKEFSGTGARILYYDRIRAQIQNLESANRGWVLPRLGLHHSLVLENKLKDRFVQDVRTHLIDPLDDQFYESVSALKGAVSDEEVVNNAAYAVQRIMILEKALEKDTLPDIRTYVESMRPVVPPLDPGLPGTDLPCLAAVHYAYQEWSQDKTLTGKKLDMFRKILSRVTMQGDNFEWLVSRWVSRTPGVDLSAFIKGYQINTEALNRPTDIKGAFTRPGRREIKSFLDMIEIAYRDKPAFSRMENRFWAWYAKEFYRSWYDFAASFPTGINWDTIVDNWQDLGALMTTVQNPYFLLLEKMGQEFEWFRDEAGSVRPDSEPAWAKTVAMLKEIKTLAKTEQKKKEGSFLAKLSMTKEKITDALDKSPAKILKDAGLQEDADLEYKMQLAQVWNTYLGHLATLSAAGAYTEKCFHMFSDLFKALSDPGKEQAPFNLTYNSLLQLDAFFKSTNTSPVIFQLVKGPYDYMTTYAVAKSALYLQGKWEEIVLSTALNTDPEKYYATMFDKSSGAIWQFINDEAAAFIGQTKTGFGAATAFGLKLPFNNLFFRLLNKGEQLKLEKQDEYSVDLTTLPTSVNEDAKIMPYSTTLLMECAGEKTALINNNFPETQTFVWRPDTCGDVSLAIQFGDSWLEKRYKGRLGFAQFLYDFKDGTHSFDPTDFPEYKGFLVNNNVTRIFVSYDINGIEPVLEFLERRPPSVPEVIFSRYVSPKGKYPLSEKEMARQDSPVQPDTAQALLKDRYAVILETVPMEVNSGALVKPTSSVFSLTCKDKVIKFENFNYPDTIDFDWVPDTCGKVLIYIYFPGVTLLKEYPDFLAFATDFKYHSKTFFSDDFPGQETQFENMGLISLTLSYIFAGDLPKLNIPKEKWAKPLSPVLNEAGPGPAEDKTKNDDKQKSSSPSQEDKAEPAPVLPPQSPLGDNGWVAGQNINNFTIQIMMGFEKPGVEKFARDNDLKGPGAIYENQLNGRKMYSLIWGSFETYQQALQAKESLSASASRHSPWIRRFGSIMKEIE
ncbi:type VI secretion protein IcmF/TssM N-terminal domain-containing protein [uncultured Desulfobacter sp.]|uniref:type VI secretion protein IcmF/TssM N-terminal domain-containing protein n=1 Tax=uncultured Desulfobacter sp. TaxID=240139 RepID=UPI002AAB1601|nr:type VI secretion protein IcmF/TssM N-terminal domain-containing protein [uncultured Desulfobacter sp.]